MKTKILSQNLLTSFSESRQIIIFSVISILSFFIPFTIGQPQWLVGTIINACLFLGVLYFPKKYFILLAVLPSLGILSRGLIFGQLTMFLVYFLPFIWIGNLILMIVFSRLIRTNNPMSFFYGVVGSAVVKFLFLFILVNIYFNLEIVPKIFLTAMGLNQLATALAGGLIAFTIFKFSDLKLSKNYKIKN